MSKEMSFLSHIGELRKHLFRIVIAIVIGAILVAINLNFIIDKFFFAPLSKDFITYRTLNSWSENITSSPMFSNLKDIKLQNLQMAGQFQAYMWASIIGGLILALPYVFYEIWKFVEPALMPKEKKYSGAFIFFCTLLFIVGILFSYFLVIPFSIQFFFNFQLGADGITENHWQLADYSAMFMQLTLGMGIVFLFPILIYFLTKLGIITPQFLTTYRKHAFVVILIIAAIITPADVSSMLIATLPLWILYEASVLAAKVVYKNQKDVIQTE